jgi:bifunctional UDP-N-acetylglucosamine pyrophosphorylase/glucosamine-1-phosphate N-acetyltransferase
MPLHVIILAAGQGKRMHSSTPKVLHQVGGKAMLQRVVEAAQALNPLQIHVVIGHGGERIRRELAALPVQWVVQTEQLGTGHAVLQALPGIPLEHDILVLSADVPLIQVETLRALTAQVMSSEKQSSLALLVADVEDPTGLGRIVRDEDHRICAIVEEKDASDAIRQIREIYTGICCACAKDFARWLPQLSSKNAQKEYYLTDIIAMAVHDDTPIYSIQERNMSSIQGVNNRMQLALLERAWQARLAEQLMALGVSLMDPARIDIRGELLCEQDVLIDVNVVFSGNVSIGEGSYVEPNCTLNNVIIGKNCRIKSHSVLEGCVIGDACDVGPFARIRPGTVLASHCKIGNFVETKNASFDTNSKASHLSYLGDVTIGKDVNIGAGTITCNYDGVNKHQTIIEDGVFIGSDTQLVAPVIIGKNATIGAGSTIRKSVPSEELTLTESRQKTVYGWRRPQKKQEEHAVDESK